MSDPKKTKSSLNLPDLNEVGAMAGKFFTDVKKSVCEIMQGYKAKRDSKETTVEKTVDNESQETTVEPSATTEEPKTTEQQTPPATEEKK